jgi:hypothetical protein
VNTLSTLLAVVCLALGLAQPTAAQERERGGRPPMARGDYGASRGGDYYGRGAWREPAYERAGPRFVRPPEARGYERPPEPRGYERTPAPGARGVPAFGGGWREQQDFLRQGVREGQLAPLGRVIGRIGQITPGRQLDSHLEYVGQRLVYRVRWMTEQGRRVDYFVDAASGAIISER